MQDNVEYWAILGRSFRRINSPDDIEGGEVLHEGKMPVFPPDYQEEAEAQRAQLLTEANTVTADWRTEFALGMLSEDDEARLKEWMLYIKAVKVIDVSGAPDIDWPVKPAA